MATLIELTSKNKPSRALIMRTIGVYLEQGHKELDIRWGEHWIEILRGGNQWFGAGWIKNISGDDIAKELNEIERQAHRQFLKDHISFVVIK